MKPGEIGDAEGRLETSSRWVGTETLPPSSSRRKRWGRSFGTSAQAKVSRGNVESGGFWVSWSLPWGEESLEEKNSKRGAALSVVNNCGEENAASRG